LAKTREFRFSVAAALLTNGTLCLLACPLGCNRSDATGTETATPSTKPLVSVSLPLPPSSSLPEPLAPEAFVAIRAGQEARLGDTHSNRWSDRCAIQRPCAPFKPFPRCAAGLSVLERLPTSLVDIEDRAVALRGTLALTGVVTTAVACREPSPRRPQKNCCNLVGTRAMIQRGESAVLLDGLGCTGDESRLCCDTPAFGQIVIAAGRLRRSSDSGAAIPWELLEPKLCVETL